MMHDVRVGDRLLDADGAYSAVLTFLVYQQHRPATNYLQISTNESTLEMTPSHLILMRRQGDTNPPRYLQANRLRLGDHIFSLSSSNERMREIVMIHETKRNDAYAPLTESGTLVVDELIVSCYAQYEHHSLIHAFMFPFRMWHKIKSHSLGFHEPSNDLHAYVRLWLSVSGFLDLLIHNV